MVEKLADSLTEALPQLTPRHIEGRIELPGKATAVIGMRRAGKTSFLHQVDASLWRDRFNRWSAQEPAP